MQTAENKEYDGIHLLRVISCFMVVLLHISAGYFHKFSARWDAALFYDAFARPCVPLFIMITGYLLLQRQEDAVHFYRKRFGRILLPLLFYSAGYFFFKNKTLDGFLSVFLSGPTEYHLWYMYMLCGLYFAMPFLQKIYAQSSNKELFIILMAWAVIYLVFPALSVFSLTAYNPTSVFYLSPVGYWGYAFLGAFLGTMGSKRNFEGALLYIAGSSITILSAYFFSAKNGFPSAPLMGHMTITTAIASTGVFLLLKDKKICIAKKLILHLSKSSFGIYLIHILIISQLRRFTPGWIYDLPPWILMPLLAAEVFAISAVIILSLKKIRYLRVLVG